MRGSLSTPARGEKGVNIVNDFFHQNIVRTPITEAFTSNRNVRYLVDFLQKSIYSQTGMQIGPQPIQYIATIMKQQYILQGPYMVCNFVTYNFKVLTLLQVHLPDLEVEKLNRAVLQILIHETMQGMQAYGRYLKDSQSQPLPPDRPESTSSKGSRQFEINYFI